MHDSQRVVQPPSPLGLEERQRARKIRLVLLPYVLRLEQQHDLRCQVGNAVVRVLDRIGDRPAQRRVSAADPGVSVPGLPKDVESPAVVAPIQASRLVQFVGCVVHRRHAAASNAEPLELR